MTEKLNYQFVTITKGIRGYFAVVVNVYESGLEEPEISGILSADYLTHPAVLDEAKFLAREYNCHVIL